MSHYKRLYDEPEYPYKKPEPHLMTVGTIVSYEHANWYVEQCGYLRRDEKSEYVNDCIAYYTLMRTAETGAIERMLITNEDVSNTTRVSDSLLNCSYHYSNSYLKKMGLTKCLT